MVMKLSRDQHETFLYWAERCLVSGRYPGPLWARFLKGCIYFVRGRLNRWRRFKASRRRLGSYRESDLIYAARARCKGCGAGLAYARSAGMHGEWDCSAVLKGDLPPTKEHPTFPFVFYEIKSEGQPSANGATTRPGVKSVKHGVFRDVFIRA